MLPFSLRFDVCIITKDFNMKSFSHVTKWWVFPLKTSLILTCFLLKQCPANRPWWARPGVFSTSCPHRGHWHLHPMFLKSWTISGVTALHCNVFAKCVLFREFAVPWFLSPSHIKVEQMGFLFFCHIVPGCDVMCRVIHIVDDNCNHKVLIILLIQVHTVTIQITKWGMITLESL